MSSFDIQEFPKQVSCGALPEFEEGIVDVELTNWSDETVMLHLPTAAVRRINMPWISPRTPDLIREQFERGIGLALAACRILNAHEDLFSIELPSLPDPCTVVVRQDLIARRF